MAILKDTKTRGKNTLKTTFSYVGYIMVKFPLTANNLITLGKLIDLIYIKNISNEGSKL